MAVTLVAELCEQASDEGFKVGLVSAEARHEGRQAIADCALHRLRGRRQDLQQGLQDGANLHALRPPLQAASERARH